MMMQPARVTGHSPLQLLFTRLPLLALVLVSMACQDHREPIVGSPNQTRMQAAVDSGRRALEDGW